MFSVTPANISYDLRGGKDLPLIKQNGHPLALELNFEGQTNHEV